MNEQLLSGRTAIVTGAGGGLGRAEAVGLAAAGAAVVVNDLGDSADSVVAEIQAAGGSAVAVRGDISVWSLADELVAAALDLGGSLDIVVNNAGIARDTMIFNLTEKDWHDVIGCHLTGHASLSRAAAAYWRGVGKSTSEPVYGRLINTSSEAFLYGSPGQPNYAAAKAGITALTLSAHHGLTKYGVTANAICPRARTGMTGPTWGDAEGALDLLSPERVATFVTWLASPSSAKVSGQVFIVYADFVVLMAAPEIEHKFVAADGVFSQAELDDQLGSYFADRSPMRTYAAYSLTQLDQTGVTGTSVLRSGS